MADSYTRFDWSRNLRLLQSQTSLRWLIFRSGRKIWVLSVAFCGPLTIALSQQWKNCKEISQWSYFNPKIMDDCENLPWWWRLSGNRQQQQDVIDWYYMYIAVTFAIWFTVNNIFEQYLIAKMSISSSSENLDEITEENLVSALISSQFYSLSWGNKLQCSARLLWYTNWPIPVWGC